LAFAFLQEECNSVTKIRVAFLVVDDRFDQPLPIPFFGTAPTALLQGFGYYPDDVDVHVISCIQKPIPCPQKLGPNIWFHGLLVPKLGYLRTFHQGCIRAVRRSLREIQPDIVHAQGTERWCAVSGAFSGHPRVLTIHGNLRSINRVSPMKPRLYWSLQTWLEIFSIPRFDGVVCITEHTRKNISDLARKTWVVPNAVDQSFFDIIRKPVKPIEIIVVAHIQELKNQNFFLEAISPLAEHYDFRVKFFGRGTKDHAYGRDFFSLLASRPWASFGGMVGREQLRDVFSRSSLLVLPSLVENCPMSVLEAMAAGVPVIASSVGGVPELICHGQTGLLIDPCSTASILANMERILVNPAFASGLADAAKKVAQEKFHPRSIAEAHINIYRGLVCK
jgi:glycosyltransferase involved in cell wall biosynthesis